MAIFDRLVFLEGDQAEAYKARKAKEAAKKEKEKEDYLARRGSASNGMHLTTDKNGDYRVTKTHGVGSRNNSTEDSATDSTGRKINVKSSSIEDIDRGVDAHLTAVANLPKRQRSIFEYDKDYNYELSKAKDAINRNMRRHPDKWKKANDYDETGRMHRESTIFESVRFLNE